MKNSFTRFKVALEGFASDLLAMIHCNLVRKVSLLTAYRTGGRCERSDQANISKTYQ